MPGPQCAFRLVSAGKLLFHLELDESDFAALGDAFAAAGGERHGPVGSGTGRLCRQRAIVDFGVSFIGAHRH